MDDESSFTLFLALTQLPIFFYLRRGLAEWKEPSLCAPLTLGFFRVTLSMSLNFSEPHFSPISHL